MRNLLLCSLLMLASAGAHAFETSSQVNAMTGAFTASFLDLGKPTGEGMGLERYYNSQAGDVAGLFGRGWGTVFEARLEQQKDGSIVVHELGNGRANRFVAEKSVLFPGERLTRTGSFYKWSRDDGAVFYFTTRGALARMGLRGEILDMVRDTTGKLVAVKDQKGQELRFKRGAAGLIDGVDGPGDEHAVYRYDAKSRLVAAADSHGHVHKYDYSDDDGKLEVITGPDSSRTRLLYQSHAPGAKVRAVTTPDLLSTEYRYQPRSTQLTLRGKSGETLSNGRFDYEVKVESTGEQWPTRIVALVDGERVERKFTRCCGNEPLNFDLQGLVRFKFEDAVVRIVVHGVDGNAAAVGSGFFISPGGALITNYHVMAPLKVQPKLKVDFELADGRVVHDFMVGECRESEMIDLCLLQLDIEPKKYFEPVESSPPRGTPTFHIGNSGGAHFVLGRGEFIGDYAHQNAGYVEVSNTIRPGDSGGPIFTLKGRLVGVSTMIHVFWNEYQNRDSGEKHFVGMAAKEVSRIRTRVQQYVPRAVYFK